MIHIVGSEIRRICPQWIQQQNKVYSRTEAYKRL